MARIWAWIRAHTGALIALGVAILGAGIFVAYESRRGRSLADSKALEEARLRVAALDERRRLLEAQEGRNAAQIQAVAAQRKEVQKAALALDRDVASMSDAEVEAAFRGLY